MSRSTSAFAEYTDYKEAFQNKGKDPILFGVRSAKAPFSVPLQRYITSQETLHQALQHPAKYHGRIFHPERRKLPDGSNEEWSADNSYRMQPYPKNPLQTFFIPPKQPTGKMNPYYKLNNPKKYSIETIRRLANNLNIIQTTVMKKRKTLEQKQQAHRQKNKRR